MTKKISLNLSEKAYENLTQLSRQLAISKEEFATLCFEYVDIKHQGIAAAAMKVRKSKNKASVNKQNLSKHLQQLSAEQIALLLNKAAQKKKN